jgi:OFA family oxalate/formate antiporter-like MFS transporter
MAGLGINLALGILYTWSIFKQAIKESIMAGDGRFNWDIASLNDPYAVCCLMFAWAWWPPAGSRTSSVPASRPSPAG